MPPHYVVIPTHPSLHWVNRENQNKNPRWMVFEKAPCDSDIPLTCPQTRTKRTKHMHCLSISPLKANTIKIHENPCFQVATPLTSFRAQSWGFSQTGVNAKWKIQATKLKPCTDHFYILRSWAKLASLWSEHLLGRRWLYGHPSLSCPSCSNHVCSHNKLAEEVPQLGSQKELQDYFCKDKNQAE